MAVRVTETLLCDACIADGGKETEIESGTVVVGVEFQLCDKHLKPVAAFEDVLAKYGQAVKPARGARKTAAAAPASDGESVTCGDCGAEVKKGSKYAHAKLHDKKASQIEWASVA